MPVPVANDLHSGLCLIGNSGGEMAWGLDHDKQAASATQLKISDTSELRYNRVYPMSTHHPPPYQPLHGLKKDRDLRRSAWTREAFTSISVIWKRCRVCRVLKSLKLFRRQGTYECPAEACVVWDGYQMSDGWYGLLRGSTRTVGMRREGKRSLVK